MFFLDWLICFFLTTDSVATPSGRPRRTTWLCPLFMTWLLFLLCQFQVALLLALPGGRRPLAHHRQQEKRPLVWLLWVKTAVASLAGGRVKR